MALNVHSNQQEQLLENSQRISSECKREYQNKKKITGSVPGRTLDAISPPCSCAPLHLFPRISLSFLFFSSFLNLLSFLLFLFLSENQNASLFLCRIFSFHMYAARLIFFSSKNIFLTFFECTCLCESWTTAPILSSNHKIKKNENKKDPKKGVSNVAIYKKKRKIKWMNKVKQNN